MIRYDSQSFLNYDIIFRFYGSSLMESLLRGLLSGFATFALIFWGQLAYRPGAGLMYFPNPFIFYFTIAAMVVAFHTNQAYSRYWEARTSVQKVYTYYADCVAQLLSFEATMCDATDESKTEDDRMSKPDTATEWSFKIAHLFSLLHAICVWTLQDKINVPMPPASEVLGGLSTDEWDLLQNVDDKPYLVQYWCLKEIACRHTRGGLPIPMPVLSRSYQQFTFGTSSFAQAHKLKDTPFPFPYIQMLHIFDFTLFVCIPFVMACWVPNIYLAVFLTILAVAACHSILAAACMMEAPFGAHANDLPLDEMHMAFNNRLLSIVDSDVCLKLRKLMFRKPSYLVAPPEFNVV